MSHFVSASLPSADLEELIELLDELEVLPHTLDALLLVAAQVAGAVRLSLNEYVLMHGENLPNWFLGDYRDGKRCTVRNERGRTFPVFRHDENGKFQGWIELVNGAGLFFSSYYLTYGKSYLKPGVSFYRPDTEMMVTIENEKMAEATMQLLLLPEEQ